MENAELEVALEELENRLERLRALYEQYFMGIERIEPQIPRKDVDRRIYVLRREKIRNTAKRFKLQTIISRYNTFQQYWQRICREIEQGTYKRHVIKAERIAPGKMLTIAARKRLGRAANEAMEEGAERDSVRPSAHPPSLAPAAPSVAPSAIPAAAAGPRLAPPPKPGAAPPKPAGPPPKPGARPPKPGVAPIAAAPSEAPQAAAAAPRAAFESLDLDMDFLGDWDPSKAAAKPSPKRPPEAPARPFGRPLSRPLNTPPAPPVATNGVKAAPPAKPIAPAAAAAPPPPPPARSGSIPPKPVSVAPRPVAPPAPVRPPMAVRPAPPPAAAKPLAAPIPGASPPKPIPARPAPPSAVAAPPAAAKPAPPPPVAAKPAAVAAPDDRVRELHARLVEAKRQTQDATAVSLEGLAKSMKATEAKLREQHKNRKIDFDVVIKDGKAVLKPIVR